MGDRWHQAQQISRSLHNYVYKWNMCNNISVGSMAQTQPLTVLELFDLAPRPSQLRMEPEERCEIPFAGSGVETNPQIEA